MQIHESGVTLIELLVAAAILAVLSAAAAPSVSTLVKDSRLLASAHGLRADLAFARSEASRRIARMTICASDDGAQCSTRGWSQGRIVFVDRTGTHGRVDDGDEIVRISQPLPGNLTLTARGGTANVAFIQFLPRGMIARGEAVTFRFCDNRTGQVGRSITVAATGRTSKNNGIQCS